MLKKKIPPLPIDDGWLKRRQGHPHAALHISAGFVCCVGEVINCRDYLLERRNHLRANAGEPAPADSEPMEL